MDADHPLVRATRAYLEVVKAEAFDAASESEGNPCLLHSQHLRLGTHFTGFGGGEWAAFLTGRMSGINMRLISQCDITPEAMSVLCRAHTYSTFFWYLFENFGTHYAVMCHLRAATRFLKLTFSYIYIHILVSSRFPMWKCAILVSGTSVPF